MQNYNQVEITVFWVEYFLNGEYHRTDGPAVIYFHPNGNTRAEYYYLNNNLHNEDGPAATTYNENGKIISAYYCLNGKLLGQDEVMRIFKIKTDYQINN